MSLFFWMAASERGHNDGIGGNIGVIESPKGSQGYPSLLFIYGNYRNRVPAKGTLGGR
jgi:hypothetical protein